VLAGIASVLTTGSYAEVGALIVQAIAVLMINTCLSHQENVHELASAEPDPIRICLPPLPVGVQTTDLPGPLIPVPEQ